LNRDLALKEERLLQIKRDGKWEKDAKGGLQEEVVHLRVEKAKRQVIIKAICFRRIKAISFVSSQGLRLFVSSQGLRLFKAIYVQSSPTFYHI
jgi:hypothetical protein